MTKVVCVDYGYGNIHSMAKACQLVAKKLGFQVAVSKNATDIEAASHVILPGVGAFADCMNGLNALPELKSAIIDAATQDKKPFLGVCVGMQMMAKQGFEHGVCDGLGWIDAQVVKLEPENASYKIPHMGWNNLSVKANHAIFDSLSDQDDVYFVHSYCMKVADADTQYIAAMSNHGGEFPAVVIKDNLIGMQFHPEKSQKVGLTLLENFLRLG
ncbi:MAG: imidazole glycerol phosphate synthase subunit HisH [Micavibrio sp.]|mgnify:CR=1 FL=1|nr:imidazole glycerol phosphate synthase subunit HisH [Micavibrio sp.]